MIQKNLNNNLGEFLLQAQRPPEVLWKDSGTRLVTIKLHFETHFMIL